MNNSTHDTSVLIALSEKRKEIVVAFRATLNVWNTVLDAAIVQISSHDGTDRIKIHQGFYIATMSLYESVSFSILQIFRFGFDRSCTRRTTFEIYLHFRD